MKSMRLQRVKSKIIGKLSSYSLLKNAIGVVFVLVASDIYSQVRVGNVVSTPLAQIETNANDKGILIPRLALQGSTNGTPNTSGKLDGLIVFNTNSTDDLMPGYYYWNLFRWNRLTKNTDISTIIQNREMLSSLVDNGDGTYSCIDENGLSNTVSLSGVTGNELVVAVDNGNGTFTLNFSDGFSFTTSNFTGSAGFVVEDGKERTSTFAHVTGTLTFNAIDGLTYTTHKGARATTPRKSDMLADAVLGDSALIVTGLQSSFLAGKNSKKVVSTHTVVNLRVDKVLNQNTSIGHENSVLASKSNLSVVDSKIDEQLISSPIPPATEDSHGTLRAIQNQNHINNSETDFNLELTKLHLNIAKRKKSIKQQLLALKKNAYLLNLFSRGKLTKTSLKLVRKTVEKLRVKQSLLENYMLEDASLMGQVKTLNMIKSFNASKAKYVMSNLKMQEILVLNNLSTLYSQIRSNELSVKCLERADGLAYELVFETVLGYVWLDKGKNYILLEKYSHFISYISKAYEFFARNDDQSGMSLCYFLLASNYYEFNQYGSALSYINKTTAIDSATYPSDSRTMESMTLLRLTKLKSSPTEAKMIASNLSSQINGNTLQDIQRGIYKILFKCYKKLSDVEKAIENLQLSAAYDQKLLFEEAPLEMTHKIVEYQFAKKQENKTNAVVEKNLHSEISDDMTNSLFIFLSAISLVMLLISIILDSTEKVGQEKLT